MSWSAWLGSIYPEAAAATRLRLNPLEGAVARRGGTVNKWSFLSPYAYDEWIKSGRTSRFAMSLPRIRTIPEAIRQANSCDIAVIQRECLPLNTTILERNLRVPFVWDVDDFLWVDAAAKRRIRGDVRKYRWLCQNAIEVWAGNQSVADWCSEVGCRRVRLVRAAVPVPEKPVIPSHPPRLIWIGTASTGPFLEQLLFDLQDSLDDFVIDIVGAEVRHPSRIKVSQIKWSLLAEQGVLQGAWAGLYPIDVTHPMSMGKSALKAVLYMAHGVPVIATRTPSNEDVIGEGDVGFLVSTPEEWREALRAIKEPLVRAEMGRRAHAHASLRFDSVSVYEDLARELQELAES